MRDTPNSFESMRSTNVLSKVVERENQSKAIALGQRVVLAHDGVENDEHLAAVELAHVRPAAKTNDEHFDEFRIRDERP